MVAPVLEEERSFQHRFFATAVDSLRSDVTLPDSTVVKNQYRPPRIQTASKFWSCMVIWKLLIFNGKNNACHAFLLTTVLSWYLISTIVVRCFQFWHSTKQCYGIFSMSVTFLQSAYICLWDEINCERVISKLVNSALRMEIRVACLCS